MGQLWTRQDWNDPIGRINDLADEGCEVAEPLEEVPEGHAWSVQDIMDAREKLTEICTNSPTFSAETVKWTQAIIDELNEAIDDCECEEGCTQELVDETRAMHGFASYLPGTGGYVSWTKDEWFDEDDEHWHFRWTYQQPYDYTSSIGDGYGISGLSGVGHTCMFHLDWVYWPYSGSPEFLSGDEVLGVAPANCDGVITSAPSGTYTKVFPVDYRLLLQPSGYPYAVWNTAGASCC